MKNNLFFQRKVQFSKKLHHKKTPKWKKYTKTESVDHLFFICTHRSPNRLKFKNKYDNLTSDLLIFQEMLIHPVIYHEWIFTMVLLKLLYSGYSVFASGTKTTMKKKDTSLLSIFWCALYIVQPCCFKQSHCSKSKIFVR